MLLKLKIRALNFCDYLVHKGYDYYHRVDTTAYLNCNMMGVYKSSIKSANRYEGSNYRIFHKVFEKLNRDWSKYTFVDLGAGKGRCMMMASKYNFKKIIGIEFSQKLADICSNNIAKFCNQNVNLLKFEVLNIDVLEYDFAQSPALYYMYNPFDGVVLREVLNKMISLRPHNSQDLIVYLNPVRSFHLELLGFKKILEIDHFNCNRAIYVYQMPTIP